MKGLNNFNMPSKKFFFNISQCISSYFSVSSIHGFRYLVDCKNNIEKFCWCFVIVISLYFAGWMIWTSIEDNNEEPILTTIETTSIKNVPFPAVTIAADGRANPWGFVKKTFDMMSFYGPDVLEDSLELRKKIDFIITKIISNIDDALENRWKDWSLSDFKTRIEDEFRQMTNTLKPLVAKLASMYMINSTISIKEQILNKMNETFFSTDRKKFDTYLTNIIGNYMKNQDLTKDTTLCMNEDESCISYLEQSYRVLLMPLEIITMGGPNLGFGTYLSYFSRLFASSAVKYRQIDFFNSLSKMTNGEKIIRGIMSNVLKKLSQSHMGNISVYELVKIVHNNADEDMWEAKFWNFGPIIKEFGCRLQARYWHETWKKFVFSDNQTTLPCIGSSKFSNCCQISKLIQENLPTVLKIMKYSIQPPVFNEPLDHFLKSYDNLDFLPFNNMTKFESRKQRNVMEYNPNPRILMCHYAKDTSIDMIVPKDCQSFHLSMTTQGIGYTFNNANFWDIFAKTNYTKLFAKVMRPKGFNKKPSPENQTAIYPFQDIHFPLKSGPSYGLQVKFATIFTHFSLLIHFISLLGIY